MSAFLRRLARMLGFGSARDADRHDRSGVSASAEAATEYTRTEYWANGAVFFCLGIVVGVLLWSVL